MTNHNTPGSAPLLSFLWGRPWRYALLAATAVGLWYLGEWTWGLYQYRQAVAAIQQRDFPAALVHLQTCRKVWPRDGNLWLLSAQTARRAGDFSAAEEMLAVAKRQGVLTRDLHVESSLLTAQQGRYAAVEDFLHERLKTYRPDFPLIAEVVSAELMRTYRLAEARQVLADWISVQPNDVEVVLRSGWVAEHQFDFDAAVVDYRRVLELDPSRAAVRLRLVDILLKIRRPEEAATYVDQLLMQPNPDAELVVLAVRCRRELGKREGLRELLERLPPTKRAEPLVLAEFAQLSMLEGDLAQAEAQFRTALEKLPRERHLLYGYQQCLSRLAKTTEAQQVGKLIQEVDRDGRRMGDILGALAKNPADADLRHEGGQLFLRNGLAEDGIRWLNMAIESDPNHRASHTFLADYYEKNGEAPHAQRHRSALDRIDAKTKQLP